MAIAGKEGQNKRAFQRNQKAINKKRQKVGDEQWTPAKGAGFIPETRWKKHSPTSKSTLDYKKKNDL